MSVGRIRPSAVSLPVYKPGKAAVQAEEEHGITDAIKLASNENPYAPIPAVVEAIRAAAATVNRYPDHGAVALDDDLGQPMPIAHVEEHQRPMSRTRCTQPSRTTLLPTST